MPSLGSSVLILGYPQAPSLQIGADFVKDWDQQVQAISNRNYDVVCTHLHETRKKLFASVIHNLKQKNPMLQMLVLAQEDDDIKELQDTFNQYPVFRISDAKDWSLIEKDIVYCLEETQMAKQELELESLVHQQNEKLKLLYQELEERVQKRQNFLLETRKKTYIANARWESLREAMIAIYQSTSTGDMEMNLLAVLKPTMQLDSIRVLLSPQDQFFSQQLQSKKNFSIFQSPLFRSEDRVGTLVFLRPVNMNFQREETDFLQQVSEAVSLALDRQNKLEQSESLKEQWQATFNAVADPVSLINQKYELVQTNSAFVTKAGLRDEQIIGQKCHQVLFQRDTPCPQCHLGKNFRLDVGGKQKSIFDVYSQQIPVEPLKTTVFVNFYHDVTEQIRMERKILESARLAEIGTIGSSIAHELNNPLGGILSFVQLIKMDLKKDDPMYEDIVSMEEGVRRCREIIENLLGFTRNPLVDEERQLDLAEVVERAVKIVELQTKSIGIDLKISLPHEPAPFIGHLNLLSQAVRNLLQASIDSLMDKARAQKGFQSLIELRLEIKESEYVFTLIDNGLGSESTSSLSLSVAGQIIHDYGGQLEFSAQSKPFRLVKFTFPRPVFQA
jgi:nitrogen-specific signal transduction histidine kinase